MAVHRLRAAPVETASETLAQRMERLRSDASAVAQEHIGLFIEALAKANEFAEQVANGGEAYPIGVREIARRTHKELAPTVLSLQAVRLRNGQ
jgi:hypothetical protein